MPLGESALDPWTPAPSSPGSPRRSPVPRRAASPPPSRSSSLMWATFLSQFRWTRISVRPNDAFDLPVSERSRSNFPCGAVDERQAVRRLEGPDLGRLQEDEALPPSRHDPRPLRVRGRHGDSIVRKAPQRLRHPVLVEWLQEVVDDAEARTLRARGSRTPSRARTSARAPARPRSGRARAPLALPRALRAARPRTPRPRRAPPRRGSPHRALPRSSARHPRPRPGASLR